MALATLFTLATIRGLLVGDLLALGPVVEGKVVGFQRSSDRQREGSPSVRIAPVIHIEYPAGTTVELRGATGWNSTSPYREGDTLPIRVNTGAPELSQLNVPSRVYGVAAVKLGLPVVLWLVAGGLWSRL